MKPGRGEVPRIADYGLGLVFLLLAVGIFIWSWGQIGASGSQVRIVSDGQELETYDLNQERDLVVDGNGYCNMIRIQDGRVSVTSATCPDQYCVRHAPISRSGEVIICLPAGLVITVTGSEEVGWDAVSR